MSAHTPGPWDFCSRLSASENHRGFFVGPVGGFRIAGVMPVDEDGTEGEANARLIAAAPELLAALRLFVKVCDSAPPVDFIRMVGASCLVARAAIEKAEGKP